MYISSFMYTIVLKPNAAAAVTADDAVIWFGVLSRLSRRDLNTI